jgi:hypothetical protein
MSVYSTNGDTYAGWESVGRWFALAGAVALAMAAVGFALNHGYLAHPLAPSDAMFAFAVQWVGFGLFSILMFAAMGSISVSRAERGSVEVTEQGVRRIFKPGHEEFFPREEIDGMVSTPGGGIRLVDSLSRRQMAIPRSIDGYRACIAELRAMGIEPLPANRLKPKWWNRKLAVAEKLSIFVWTFAWVVFLQKDGAPLVHHSMGVALLAPFVLLAALEYRKTGKRNWGFWLVGGAIALTVVVLRWSSLR